MIRVSLQRSVLFSRFEVPSVINSIKLSCLTVIGAFNSMESMKIQNPYPKRSKVASFVRQIKQFHQSVYKIIGRTAMTEADSHSCFLHGRCWVPIPVGILQLLRFVRQIKQLHQSVNEIIGRTAMTEADSHSCFLHGRCWVPIPVGILQLPHFGRGQSEVAPRPWTLFNRILSLHLQIHDLYQWL